MPIQKINHEEIIASLIITHGLFDKSNNLSAPMFYGLEIGCLRGEFDRYLLNKFSNLHMTSIDPTPIFKDVRTNIQDYDERFTLIQLKSDEVKFINREFDFIFIDGDHSYEQNKKDIERFIGLVKPGGFISGHNYDQYIEGIHPGVKKSVDEIFGNKVKFLNSDVTWWVSL